MRIAPDPRSAAGGVLCSSLAHGNKTSPWPNSSLQWSGCRPSPVCKHNPQGPLPASEYKRCFADFLISAPSLNGFQSAWAVTCDLGQRQKLSRRFNFWTLFFGVLLFSISVSLCYIVPWLWESCINKNTVMLLYYGFCFPALLQLIEFFSLIIWVPDSIVIARTKKRITLYYTVNTWQLFDIGFCGAMILSCKS